MAPAPSPVQEQPWAAVPHKDFTEQE